MRAAIYRRSATANKAHLERQTTKCSSFAIEHYCTIVESYEDAIQSGVANDGPALTRMMGDASDKKFDAIIVEDVSRLSRRLERLGELAATLRELGISLLIVDQAAWTGLSEFGA